MAVRLSYNNFSNPNGCWKEINISFYCRAPFQFNNYPSDSKWDMKKVAVYDVPHASSIKCYISTLAFYNKNLKK